MDDRNWARPDAPFLGADFRYGSKSRRLGVSKWCQLWFAQQTWFDRTARGKRASTTEPPNSETARHAGGNHSLICPTGKSLRVFRNGLSSPFRKNIFVFARPKSDAYPSPSRSDKRGGSRVVTNAGRDAVDVRASGAPWQSQGEMNLVSDQPACKMIGAFRGR